MRPPATHALLALTALTACTRGDAPASAPPEASVALVDATPSPPRAPPSPPIPPVKTVFPCRAMEVKGAPVVRPGASDGGARAIATGDTFPFGAWVDLRAGESVTAKWPRTGRELSLVGPATVMPCVGDEETWLLRGTFRSSRGSGESPGAEQWVVTPFGVVRFGIAFVEITVGADAMRASLKGGSATLLAAGEATWEPLSGATALAPRLVKGAPLGSGGRAEAADRCAKAQAASDSLDAVLAQPGATTAPGFADTAMRANDARVVARAACAVSKLRDAAEPR